MVVNNYLSNINYPSLSDSRSTNNYIKNISNGIVLIQYICSCLPFDQFGSVEYMSCKHVYIMHTCILNLFLVHTYYCSVHTDI
jgi:hypothetical protein